MSENVRPGVDDENFTEKTHAENLEEKYEEDFNKFVEDLLRVHSRLSRVYSMMDLARTMFLDLKSPVVLNVLNDAMLQAKFIDERFPDGFAEEITKLSNQFDEWQTEKDADPAEPTGGHEGHKDFL